MKSFYRKYIQGIVSQANKQKSTYQSEVVYTVLTQWLRMQDLRLEKEMFKAVLDASKKLAQEYLSTGKKNVKGACENSFFYHTFTAPDEVHTDVKIVEGYVKDLWPALKLRLDEEADMGDADSRMKRVDVVRMGKLFDAIVDNITEEESVRVVELMDEFVRSELK